MQAISNGMYEVKIGHVLKRCMREKDLKLNVIHRRTKIPYSTLHGWQENRLPRQIGQAQVLADFLGISLTELLFDIPKIKIEPSQADSYRFSEGEYHVTVRKIK